ncbi:MAG TPA: phosphatidylglycerophosphatase A [candidate division Zixibacteria bacterium]|nr:phosphatidylglycerophosphatase A [candidate division Zixibacteria bacterium]
MRDFITKLIATGLFSGCGKPFPGTWGTIPAWLIAFFFIKDNLPVMGVVTVVTIIISIWSATEAEKLFGHDAKKIVIDEWAGMFITLLLVPYSLTAYAIGFVAFRAFDVVKVPPAAQLEGLPKGWGVTMDDVMAGIYANIATQLIVRFLLG